MKNWLLLFIWMGFIFFLSHQPDLKSGLSSNLDFILRKSAHFLEYAVLTWLFFRALGQNNLGVKLPFGSFTPKFTIILAVVFSILYAFSDEWHQSFIPGRQSSLRDVGVDSFGVISAAWLIKRKMIE